MPITATIFAVSLIVGCRSQGREPPPEEKKDSPAETPGRAKTLSTSDTRKLKALGYFDRKRTRNPNERSVTREREAAFDGLNLYGSRHRAKAFLTDMNGKVQHTWTAENPKPPWMHMVLRPNGDLLVIAKTSYLAKLDWRSKVLWRHPLPAHHDITVAPDGRIYVLTHRVERYLHNGAEIPIMGDALEILSPDGTLQRKVPLFPILRPLVSNRRLDLIRKRLSKGVTVGKLVREGAPADTTHGNSIFVIDRPLPDVAPEGAVLMSFREINRIVILNPGLNRLLWVWGKGELEGQHHATLLENGNIMVFDNGVRRKKSRVIEVNPKTRRIEWTYASDDFYSRLRGAAQQLPNGNVLITESDKGHVFEVTRNSQVLWEFWNPDVIPGDPPTRGVIYRMTRYEAGYLDKGLSLSNAGGDNSPEEENNEPAITEED